MDAIDCLGFAGGFTLGTVQAGWDLVGKREYAAGFGMPACEANRHLLGERWDAQTAAAEEWQPYQVPYVFGNPPCSGFSLMTSPHIRGMGSHINACMWDFTHFAARCRPDTVVMESVGQAFTQGRPLMVMLRDRLEEMTGERYWITHVLQDSYSLGGCAIRRRYMLVMSRFRFGVEPPELQRPLPTLWDAIGDLAEAPLKWDPFHHDDFIMSSPWAAPLLSEDRMVDGHLTDDCATTRRMHWLLQEGKADIPQGKNLEHALEEWWKRTGDLPDAWHATKSAEKTRTRHAAGDFWQGMNQPRRWVADRAARVITGAALGCVIHPTQPRMITHREAMRVMGFPDDWRVSSLAPKKTAPYYGKGVTVGVGRWVSEWVKRSLEGSPGEYPAVQLDGERESLVDVSKLWRQHADNRGRPFAPGAGKELLYPADADAA